MTVCIAGMHRSGTSMVARHLNLCGLYLGPDDDLIPASVDNPRGYWENTGFVGVNDELLHELGGGWDFPPPSPVSWHAGERFLAQRSKAEELVAEFGVHRFWGWKDPRNSLTLPFWRGLLPELKVVVCLRHPLEVALSLQRRGMSSRQLSLALWVTYNRRLLEATTPDERIVTHYDSYYRDPRAELQRLARFVGLRPSKRKLDEACLFVDTDQRHASFSRRDLLEVTDDPDVVAFYTELCEMAAVPSGDVLDSAQATGADGAVPTSSSREQRRGDDVRLHAWHYERRPGSAYASAVPAGRGPGDPKLDAQMSDIQQQLALATKEWGALNDSLQRQADLLGSVAERTDELGRRQREQARWLESIEQAAERRAEEMQASLYAIEQASRRDDASASPKEIRYRELVRRVRELVRATVPADATVSVISKGDDDLVRLYGRRAWHFPRDAAGQYSGYHPKGDLAALIQLEAQRAAGADYIVIPSTSLWWLDYYGGFRRQLENKYREVARDDDICRLYDLRHPSRPANPTGELGRIVAELSYQLGREAVILDATANSLNNARDVSAQVFRFDGKGTLPYLDETVDAVVVDEGDRDGAASAGRIASLAVLHMSGDTARVEWKSRRRTSMPSISVIIPVFDGVHHTKTCLESLGASLSPTWDAEIIVVDDSSTDGTGDYLATLAGAAPRLTVLRNSVNQGYLASVTRGADVATGEILIFLNNDTVLLPGWLEPLVRTFTEYPDAGAVGGRLVYPDGRLQEAGGLVFRDGSAAKFGYGDVDFDDPLFAFVRDVDYSSGALLATPRSVFEEIGGFDREFAPGYYEDTDYCFSVRALGKRVYYQPESTIIHVEGGTAGTDLDVGAKRYQVINQAKFVDKWADALREQPERPQPLDRRALQALAMRRAETLSVGSGR